MTRFHFASLDCSPSIKRAIIWPSPGTSFFLRASALYYFSLSIFRFCRLVLLLRRRHSVPSRSSITFVAFPQNATRQATLQHGPQQSSSVLPPPAGLCRFTCGRRSDGRSTSVLNCVVSSTPPLGLTAERSASECEPTSETADLDQNGTLTPRPIQDVRCAEDRTCRGHSNGV